MFMCITFKYGVCISDDVRAICQMALREKSIRIFYGLNSDSVYPAFCWDFVRRCYENGLDYTYLPSPDELMGFCGGYYCHPDFQFSATKSL